MSKSKRTKKDAISKFLEARQASIPASIMRSIKTKHQHETKGNPPLWLLWRVDKDKDGNPLFPTLDSVCDSAFSAVAHVGMIMDENVRRVESRSGDYPCDVYVERIPANHRFGGSLPEMQMKGYHTIRAFRKRNQLDGE